jgi:hypothetical protein
LLDAIRRQPPDGSAAGSIIAAVAGVDILKCM